jgi:hypothetical protein
MAMRIGKANNRFIIPVEDAIQQTHCPGVRNQNADFRFVDRRVTHKDAGSAIPVAET